ncbi:MAG: 1-acyl-sn-glycerol-3-phosphate acyltransferase, partial [Thermodesulfobacteriota bacterium]|nr:1-acyl-sn-glycerol-3-phosphate acyltransferase [Thermodesulfobacteriota bacterium]
MVFSKQLKRLVSMPLKTAINRIDFVKIIERLNRSEAGRTWAERLGPPKSAFHDQEDIITRTVELTEADLAERGQKTSREEVEAWAQKISCRYDHELHGKTKSALSMVLDHLFIHEDTSRIFLSGDKRELAHFERVRQVRRDGMGVVYLVNHSTHFDEFVLDIVLDQLGVELPLFAAGANMMATPSLERILMTGSYVIVRKGATKAYLATLFNYCRALGEMGKQQGIFLEAWSGGARTRDGSLRYPRRLVTLQGALASARDILVQPVVISYSAVPEDLSLSERAGSLSWVNGLPYFRNWIRSPHRPFKALGRALNGIYGRPFITF